MPRCHEVDDSFKEPNMKTERGGLHRQRREPAMTELVEDSYKLKAKLAEPTSCPKCGATYRKGRWTWTKPPADAHWRKCPACRRIEDRFPAGFVTLGGPFLAEHRAEVLNLVKARETRAKADFPMQRIIAVENADPDILVTTTDSHLARSIAKALHEAFKGELEIRASKDENLVRALWRR
jgi:hypothetical protein